MFLEDMKQNTTNVWRIPVEVVKENEDIQGLKTSRPQDIIYGSSKKKSSHKGKTSQRSVTHYFRHPYDR
jgi:hypothetical protein